MSRRPVGHPGHEQVPSLPTESTGFEGVTARFRRAAPRGLGLGRSLLARPADASTDAPALTSNTSPAAAIRKKRSRPCCPPRRVHRLGLRGPCPTPAASATCRRTVTAPAPARIQPPGRRSHSALVAAVDVSVSRRCGRDHRAVGLVLAATASTRSIPLWRSNTTGSPVCASTAAISTGCCGQCWLGSRAATMSRQRVRLEPSEA